MKTKIIFRYSRIYDRRWKESGKFYGAKDKNYPSPAKIRNYIKKAEKEWRKHEIKVLTELSKITGLKWQEKTIVCYVVGRCIPFSDPLTMKVYKDLNRFIDVLIHELIHRLMASQEGNLKKSKKAWDYFYGKYKNESFTTAIHVPLHAFHTAIFLKFFGKKRMENEIRAMNDLPDYGRSWDIVKKEGYKTIIENFKKRIKK